MFAPVLAAGAPMLAMADGDGGSIGLLLFLSGFVFYAVMYLKYRNIDKRHMHARETEATMDNLRVADDLQGRRTRQRNARMQGANERQIEGAQNSGLASGILGSVSGSSVQDVFTSFTKR